MTLNEIPANQTWQMTNFVAAFLPGYYLATNSSDDGYTRSVVLSRFPIARSQSWLEFELLEPFGYSEVGAFFTRDLFEAEIHLPGMETPLHIFTTHLKAGTAADSMAKRAAEASAISNFLVTSFLPTKGDRLYVLAGDLNEDVGRPRPGSGHPIERLANEVTGLHLTTPRSHGDNDDRTISIQTGLFARYDYILPCNVLYSNTVGSQVFRSDRVNPLMPPLRAYDSQLGSDHLPVFMVFQNPFNLPFRLTRIQVNDQAVQLEWNSVPSQQYQIEGSIDLIHWQALSPNLIATGIQLDWLTKRDNGLRFFRVRCLPPQ
jgi:endonuclease/exonuclease/phosphatase family metal-dependent hydrolase